MDFETYVALMSTIKIIYILTLIHLYYIMFSNIRVSEFVFFCGGVGVGYCKTFVSYSIYRNRKITKTFQPTFTYNI